KAGSGFGTLRIQGSPGVPESVVSDTVILPYNDLKSVRDYFNANPGMIAAIIVEPVAGNMGCIPPAKGFLPGLRKLCNKEQALLIYDEVMTGFRVARGGAIEKYGIMPDIVTYGKIIGGGLPVGAYGGRKKFMSLIAPSGPVYQAGTLSGNPLAMTAGNEVLRVLKKNPGIYDELERKGSYLEDGLIHELADFDIPFRINRIGSMISLHFTPFEVTNFAEANASDKELFKSFFHSILKNGIYWPPSPFESAFISNAHSMQQLDKTIAAFKAAFKKLSQRFKGA
ncbi:MAG TPA: aminotransferase class III-fold pyridoxal phosphate-dependent enzyme, partial [Cyclobacteriaceae bacterium]|nr:aminotransferase class III-fold pyridoxal phosphate-dependent enzyme [Cyclobacteriaceae bacterium]